MNKLLDLKIANFRSFLEEQTLSFQNKIDTNITAIYGPNASGKSNTASALMFMKWFLQNSTTAGLLRIPFEPFLLRVDNASPTSLEIEFVNDERSFRYGFSFTPDEVISESLVELTTQKEKIVFERDHQQIVNLATAKKFGFTNNLMNKTLKTGLLVTKAREDNNEYANAIFEFMANFHIITVGSAELRNTSIGLLKTYPQFKAKILDFLQNADFWIRDLVIDDVDVPDEAINSAPLSEQVKNLMRGQKAISITTQHSVRDNTGKIVGKAQLALNGQESVGTNVMFDLAILVIYAFEKDALLYIDEFDLHLHTDICKYILAQFRKNPSAQLILNTHNTALMSDLKREEIVLIDKNQGEESIVTPLIALSPRKEEPLEKRYLQGFYGAKPFIRGVE